MQMSNKFPIIGQQCSLNYNGHTIYKLPDEYGVYNISVFPDPEVDCIDGTSICRCSWVLESLEDDCLLRLSWINSVTDLPVIWTTSHGLASKVEIKQVKKIGVNFI